MVITFLSVNATPAVLQKARALYGDGGYDLKKSMLKLFNKVGGWATIGDIIIGTIHENESIRQLSVRYLWQWKIKSSTYFIKPKAEELERANQLFRFAFDMHNEKMFYNPNPLTGFDFYLK